MPVDLSTLPIWQAESFTEQASLWQRNPGPGGATYTLHESGVPCYHFPRQPTENEVEEFGQIPATIYVWVFAEAETVPGECCVTSGGRAYISLGAPVVFPNIGVGEGGHIQLVTNLVSPPPTGVTV